MKKILKISQFLLVLLASLLLTSCKEKTFSVILEPRENIIVDEDLNLGKLLKDTSFTLQVEPPEGMEVDKFIVNGKVVELQQDNKCNILVTQDLVIRVTFKEIEVPPETFSLTLGDGISADIADLTAIDYGTKVNLAIHIPQGKEIDRFIVDGFQIQLSSPTYQLTVTQNHTITVTFKDIVVPPETYKVTLGSGLSSSSVLTGLSLGTTVNINILVPSGYEIDKFYIDGQEVAIAGNTYALVVNGNHNVTVRFKEIQYTVTLGDGLTSPNNLTGIFAGEQVTINLLIPEHYELDSFKVDGQSVTITGNSYILTVNGNHNVTVTYRKLPTYTVTLGHGLSSNDTLTGLYAGETVTINLLIPEYYELDNLRVDDRIVAVTGTTYELTVSGNHHLIVLYRYITPPEPTYTVTIGNGLSSLDTLTDLVAGSIVTINITIPENQVIDKFKVDNQVISVSGTTYQLTVSGDHNVTVTFKNIPRYYVSLSLGLTTSDNTLNLLYGDIVNISVVVPENDEIKEFRVDGQVIELSGTTYQLTVTGNHMVTVSFKGVTPPDPNNHSVTMGNGLSCFEPLDNLPVGTKVQIHINIPSGHEIDEFKVDDEVVAVTGTIYELTVSKNHELSVTFKPITTPDPETYTVTLGAGLTSPNPLTNLASGAIVNININIPSGQEIKSFKVDGNPVLVTGNTYQLTVSRNHNVTVEFKAPDPETYTVTLGTGLSSPNPLTNLAYGAIVNINITIPSGKEIKSFKVDGQVVVVSGTTYQLTVSGNHVVSVEFKDITSPDPETYNVTLGAGLSSPNPLTNLASGAIVNINITIPSGKEIKSFKVDGQVVAVSGTTYQLTVSGNHVVSVEFKDITSPDPESYNVTLGTGLSSSNPLTNLASGAIVNINIIIPEGQEIKEFKVDDALILVTGNIYQLMVSGNHHVTVSFNPIFVITQNNTENNEYVLDFSEEPVFSADINNKLAFMQTHFTTSLDYSYVNFDALTLSYSNLQLRIVIGSDIISKEYFQSLDINLASGNGIVRLPFKLKVDSIKSLSNNAIAKAENIDDYVLKLSVPFADNNADYSQTITPKFYTKLASIYDEAYDPTKEHTVKFISVDAGYEVIVTVNHREKVNRPAAPVKPGSVFGGWESGGEKFDFNTEIKSNLNLYARWLDASMVASITFDTQSPIVMDPQYVEKGTVPSIPNPIALDGFEFVEWRLNGSKYNFDTPVNNDIVLVAVWEQKFVKVTINLNGGTGDTEYYHPYGKLFSTADLFGEVDAPTKLGYVFAGYKQDFDDAYNLYKPTTVDVVWLQSDALLKLNHMYNGIIEQVPTLTNDVYTKGMSPFFFMTPLFGPIPERPGYIFVGWYTTPDYSVSYVVDSSAVIGLNYYARWVKESELNISMYTVTFNTHGGSPVDPVQTPVGLSANVNNKTTTKLGFKFDGWYLDSEYKLPYTSGMPFYYDTDMTLHAKWVVDSGPSETISINLVTNSPLQLESIQVPKGVAISLNTYVGTKEYQMKNALSDYKFIGWYDQGYQNKYDMYNLKSYDSDITIYAKWEKKIKVIGFLDTELIFTKYLDTPTLLSNVVIPKFVTKNYELYSDSSLTVKLVDSPQYSSNVTSDFVIYLQEKPTSEIPNIEYNIILNNDIKFTLDSVYGYRLDQDFLDELGYGYYNGNYVSDGLYLDSTLTTQATVDNYLSYVVNNKLDLYVKWVEINYVKVITDVESLLFYGSLDVIPIHPTDTVIKVRQKLHNLWLYKPGYEVEDYYLDPGYTQKVLDATSISSIIGSNVYVKFTKIEERIATVDTGGILTLHKIDMDYIYFLDYPGYAVTGMYADSAHTEQILDTDEIVDGQTVYFKLEKACKITVYKNDTDVHGTYIVAEGQVISENLYLPNPIKEDEMILGWKLNGVDFDIHQPFVWTTNEAVLKPVWGPHAYFTVQFEIDGVIQPDKTTQILQNTRFYDNDGKYIPWAPYKENYDFMYWKTQDNVEFDNYTYVTKDLIVSTVYVAEDDMITISYNTGIDGVTIEAYSMQRYSKAEELPTYNLTKPGHLFKGWLYNGNELKDSDRITDSVTLIANWIEKPTYSVTIVFSQDLPSKTIYIPQKSTINISKYYLLDKYHIPVDTESYIISKYTIDGVEVSGNYQVLSDITITVHLLVTGPATITFMIGETVYQTNSYLYTINNPFEYLPKPDDKEDEIFRYWTYEGVEVTDDTIVTGDMTLYAYYSVKEYVTVSFVTNVSGIVYPDQSVLKYRKMDEPRSLTKENHKFLYWTIQGENQKFNFTSTEITESIILEAVWQSSLTYTLTVNMGEGYDPVKLYFPKNQYVSTYRLDEYYELNPNGYYYFEDFLYEGESTYGFNINGNMTIDAVWEDRTPVTVTFMVEGTQYATVDVPKNTYIYQHWSGPDMPDNPTHETKIFKQWETSDGTEFNGYTVVTEAITVYAIWWE